MCTHAHKSTQLDLVLNSLCKSFFQKGTCIVPCAQMQRTTGCGCQSNYMLVITGFLRQGSFNFSLTICSVTHEECRFLFCCRGCTMCSVLLSGSFLSVSLVVHRSIHRAVSRFTTCPGGKDHFCCSERLHTVPDHGAKLVNTNCETFGSLY